MDKKTLDLYDQNSQKYAQTWLDVPKTEEIHKIVLKYFVRRHDWSGTGADTSADTSADIGSGSGRDVHWLNTNGFPCVGFDASRGLMQDAQLRFPQYIFKYAALPLLKEIGDEEFCNVLCETVLMHLPREEQLEAVDNLFRILSPKGVLSLSWRHKLETDDSRDEAGRLYARVDRESIIQRAKLHKAECVYQNTSQSSLSGKLIDQLVFIKS